MKPPSPSPWFIIAFSLSLAAIGFGLGRWSANHASSPANGHKSSRLPVPSRVAQGLADSTLG